MKFKIEYNPLEIRTKFLVDGAVDNRKNSKFKPSGNWANSRMQSWIDDLIDALCEEFNDSNYDITFIGTKLDAQDVEEAIHFSQNKYPKIDFKLNVVERQSPEDSLQKLNHVYEQLKDSGRPEFNSAELTKAVQLANNIEFPVNVIATMSAGKSTLLNAILGTKILPAANEATTAKTTEIHDQDKLATFRGWAYNARNQQVFKQSSNVGLETMSAWNDDHNEKGKQVSRIKLEGNINFVSNQNAELVLIDTPGPNNSQDRQHEARTYNVIENEPMALVIYVMNATQLKTNDDKALLKKISESMQVSKQARDRFLFVVNKLDTFGEEDNIQKTMQGVEDYLRNDFHIDRAQIFGASSLTALEIKTVLHGVTSEEMDTMGRHDPRSQAVGNAFKLVDNPSMHLEKYGEVPGSIRAKIQAQLEAAHKVNDYKTEALIHSGIPTLEAAIQQYVEKYSKGNKVRAVVDSFYETVNVSTQIHELKDKIAEDSEYKKKIEASLERLNEELASGDLVAQLKTTMDAYTDDSQSGKDTAFASIKRIAQKLRKDADETRHNLTDTLTKKYSTVNPENRNAIMAELNNYAKRTQLDAMAKYTGAIKQDAERTEQVFSGKIKDIIKKLGDDVELSANNIDLSQLVVLDSNTLETHANQMVQTIMAQNDANLEDVKQDKEVTVQHQEERTYDTGARWYKFWTWGRSRYETRTVTVEKKEIRKVTTKDTKSIDDYLKLFFAEFKARSAEELKNSATKISHQVAKELVHNYEIKVAKVEQSLQSLSEKLMTNQANQSVVKAQINKNKQELKWLQGIMDEIQSAVSFKS